MTYNTSSSPTIRERASNRIREDKNVGSGEGEGELSSVAGEEMVDEIVVVCLPRPMEGMGRLQFSDLFSQNCQFHHRRLESLEHLMCLIYILLSTTVSHFSDLTDDKYYSMRSQEEMVGIVRRMREV